MNFLSRKTSSKSLTHTEDRGRGDRPNDAAVERAQSESKPSLFNRLRRSSRSEDRDGQKGAEPSSPQPDEVRHGRKVSVDGASLKFASTKVATVLGALSGQVPSSNDALKKKQLREPETALSLDPVTHKKLASLPAQSPAPAHAQGESGTPHKSHHEEGGLTKEDVEHLFSGAPQFVLEKGRRGRYFPQTFFPWNKDLEIGDLQDRRYLKHESFALATLHAHLPIPDEVNWKPGLERPAKKEGLESGKRPMFELGIFERPNMLGLEAREPGTISFRYFLERPVMDGVADENTKEHGKDVEIELAIANAPSMEAFKMLAISRENDELNAKVGKHAPAVERAKLIREGPQSWKMVGVRNISMETLVQRMDVINHQRDQIVKTGWRDTVLNHTNAAELFEHLFADLLYPPRKIPIESKHDKSSMKIQIEALVKVLTTPGAWVDLSAPEARLRFGKILHSRSTRYDQDTGMFTVDPERKWLLVQLLLSVELVIRLDAALRLGIALHAESFEVSSEEIHHFNKLRNLKVDWDLVAARRFLMLSYTKKIEKKGSVPNPQLLEHQRPSNPRQSSSTSRERSGSLLGGLKHVIGFGSAATATARPMHDVCDVVVMPRQPGVMVDGLFRFATNIGWPRGEELQHSLKQKLCTPNPEDMEKLLMDTIVCAKEEIPEAKLDNLIGSLQSFNADLHAATPATIGGWLSHSWLSGLIMPGTSICDILMSTLLENDTDPQTLRELGSQPSPLRGSGFILNGSSWWSKSCIVGRVIAPMRAVKESMGWVFAPNLVPLYENTLQPVANRWVKIKSFPVLTHRERPRIFDGDKLAEDSTPLGKGKGGIMGSEFTMVTDVLLDKDSTPEVKVKDIKIHLSSSDTTQDSTESLSAFAQFDLSITKPTSAGSSVSTSASKKVRYSLNRAVYFVTAHPCRLPHGHATFKPGTLDFEREQQHPQHKPGVAEHIPAHPLHTTYKFEMKSLADLVLNPRAEPPNPTNHDQPVWIVDARGHASQKQQQPPQNSTSSTATPPSDAATKSNIGLAITSPTINRSPSPGATDAQFMGWLQGSSDPQLWEKDILVRAWCAEKGRNAIIARKEWTCLSCAIREARALEVSVIVRVGIKE